MASHDTIHFVLRPNKNVERKLIADVLTSLSPHFAIHKYRYIGMGSFWFADFLLFHKLLLIEDMISIERTDYADRAEFNRPLRCIRVEAGDTSKVLPDLDLSARESIIWLDYDSDLRGPVLQDCRIVCGEAKGGSVFLVTLGAHVNQIKNQKDQADRQLEPLAALKFFAPDLVPAGIEPSALSLSRFPKTLADILIAHMHHCTRKANPDKRFIPLFKFVYRDNAPMVTVGGMILEGDAEKLLDQCRLREKFEYVTGEREFEISVPPLTVKEKIALDQLLPHAQDLRLDDATQKLGFELTEQQLRAYQKFYRQYPLFGEMQL